MKPKLLTVKAFMEVLESSPPDQVICVAAELHSDGGGARASPVVNVYEGSAGDLILVSAELISKFQQEQLLTN